MRIFDAHCDTLCKVCDGNGTLTHNSYQFDLTRAGKDYMQIFACFISPEYSKNAMQRFLSLAEIFNNSNASGILSVEGADMIECIDDLEPLIDAGVKVITPVWNYENHLATGVLGNKDNGLTALGKELVGVLNKKGILIDYSHMNDKSFYDTLNISSSPIIATHSNSRAICKNPRNLTDEQFKEIIRTNGCVGINFYPLFLNNSNNATIDNIFCHIEHFLELGGEDNIGFGTDFDGVDCLPKKINGCEDMIKIIEEMEKRNYTSSIIEKICYKNWERIFINERNTTNV
ncbi:MAG: dipeptidase [Clostridia bacterium]|nr:dipeptidase [Clostridia bacterium]